MHQPTEQEYCSSVPPEFLYPPFQHELDRELLDSAQFGTSNINTYQWIVNYNYNFITYNTCSDFSIYRCIILMKHLHPDLSTNFIQVWGICDYSQDDCKSSLQPAAIVQGAWHMGRRTSGNIQPDVLHVFSTYVYRASLWRLNNCIPAFRGGHVLTSS